MKNGFICGLYTIRDLDEIRLNIKNEVHDLSKSHLKHLYNRYTCDLEYEAKLNDKVNQLHSYERVLTRVKEQTLAGGTICLDRESLQCLIEKIVRIVGKNCTPTNFNYQIDKDREEDWVVKNPFCRTYEDWEKWAKFFAGKINLQVTSETEVLTNLILEVTREIITPNVLLAISAYTEVQNNVHLEVSRSDEEIKLDFQLLVEQVPTFDLNLKVYKEIIKDHKLSFDIVKTVYDEGLSLQLTTQEVQLKTPVNAYNLAELSGNIDPSYLKKFGMEPTINKNDLLQDYK